MRDAESLGIDPPSVKDAHKAAVRRPVWTAYVGKSFREYVKSTARLTIIGIIPGVGPKENIERMPESVM